jgi:NADPH2:quinone reductase
VPLNLALLKSSHIIGVDWRTFVMEQPGANRKNVGTLLDLWRDHLIKPDVTEMFPFDAAPEAITRLESRQALGKIVVSIGER